MICNNCSHKCDIPEGKSGICHARSYRNGAIVCDNYGHVTSLALDPIEKKPLARFYPGSKILSVGSYGCNMHCMWCQNDSISRGYVDSDILTAQELVDTALNTRERGNIGIAYTYNEPSVGYEFVRDCAILAKEHDLVNVSVTNGMLDSQRFCELLPYMDAYNIDLKTGIASKYEAVGGDIDLIERNIESAHRAGKHVELTTLVVPGFNDATDDFKRIIDFIAALDRLIPLHITRFFPAGDMKDVPPTKLQILYDFKQMAEEKLKYVYLGNV